MFIGPRIFDLTKIRPDLPGGIFFRFPALQLRPSAGDLLRAFLEGLTFAVRSNMKLLEGVLGRSPARLLVGGGMTRSTLFLQILADVTGLPLHAAEEPESTGLGVAILAATGAGLHPDLATATRAMCRQRRVEIDPSMRERYEASFTKWMQLYDALDTLGV
jgi:autoinducer 2 (AI-2) kinase